MIDPDDKALFEINFVWQAGWFEGITGERPEYDYKFRRIGRQAFVDQFKHGMRSGKFTKQTGIIE